MSDPTLTAAELAAVDLGSLTPPEAEALQRRIAASVEVAPLPLGGLRTVAGLDVAYSRTSDTVTAAVVVLDATTQQVLAQATATGTATFPYVPGLLAFREVPVLLRAWERLEVAEPPDVLVCDGAGRAHPRRAGLACHLGLLLGLPSVGVSKTPSVGGHEPPGPARGDWAPVVDGGEVVGRALRTRDGTKEVWMSVGHRADLDSATALVLATATRYRLPEPVRAADHLGRRVLRAGV
ncbi:deoxyribonuclease V [Kineococcus xinjiangensis]|uniref:Endonuclease V n=1 Tax=Kineococcus xinjiangensis TaxID=512762 RepID=A0A2S6ISN5_9ACTN|nr:endonuclease V [Kineococcus xinjiangensis]PPK97257.1 deoxyribonuclease V [Kineococcus xinjiangensis]